MSSQAPIKEYRHPAGGGGSAKAVAAILVPEHTALNGTRGDSHNTTVYALDDRFRGGTGTREVLPMNRDDMARFGFEEGDAVCVSSASNDIKRELNGMRVQHGSFA